MSGGINFAGLTSGIDTNAIIEQLLAVDKRPADLLTNDIARLNQRQAAYGTVSAQLLNLQAASFSLNALRAFDIVTASVADSTVIGVDAQTGAQTGTHTLSVTSLATAQKVSSAAQTSQTAPLNFSGQIIVNGKAVNVATGDSLQTLASNINAAQSGVTASIISPSANQYYLTFASTNTGVQSKISLADTGSGDLLGALGVFSAGGTTSNRHQISAGVIGSNLFADSATSIGTLEGQTAPAAGNAQITIGGVTQTVAIDLGHDSLSAIAARINTAFGGSNASVATVTDPVSGATRQQLQITGATALTDDKNVLTNLGLTQRNYDTGRELTQAQDAVFTIDGLAATRATNSFSDAVTGVTISLVKPGTSDFTVGSDTASIKTNIAAFVTAFNNAVDQVGALSQYDASSGKTSPLFGDVTSQSIVDALVSNASGSIPGLPSNLSLLSQAGITLDQGNHLVIDDTKLSSALATNLDGVAHLFRANGTPSDPTIQFVSSTGDTRPSGAGGYNVVITQPATQATYTAATAQTGNLAQDEVLTFGGPLFGSSAVTAPLTGGKTITLRAGSSLDDVISQINGDANIGKVVSASKVGGKLQLVSKSYGASAEFAVVSGVGDTGNGDTGGIGTTVRDQKGLDVAGTINGESATGIGQYLTGSQQGAGGTGKGSAFGLQLRVTATAPTPTGPGATIPTVAFTSGIADVTRNYINTQTDVYTGALSTAVNNLQDNVKDIQSSIDEINGRLKDEESTLRLKFTAMETAIARIKANSSGLAQLAK